MMRRLLTSMISSRPRSTCAGRPTTSPLGLRMLVQMVGKSAPDWLAALHLWVSLIDTSHDQERALKGAPMPPPARTGLDPDQGRPIGRRPHAGTPHPPRRKAPPDATRLPRPRGACSARGRHSLQKERADSSAADPQAGRRERSGNRGMPAWAAHAHKIEDRLAHQCTINPGMPRGSPGRRRCCLRGRRPGCPGAR